MAEAQAQGEPKTTAQRWAELGHVLGKPVTGLGELALFFFHSIVAIFRPPFRIASLFTQLDFMAFGSLFVVGLTGMFTGMVFALQLGYAFGLFNAQSLVGATVELALARELAPIFTSIVVVARVGSAVATELGTMRVTEQIDALETMAVDPFNYLVVPRILAAAMATPLLTMLFNLIGIVGAYGVAVLFGTMSPATFLNRLEYLVEVKDITLGLGKGAVIGFVVILIAAYRGYSAKGGARGVGIATTQAVVGGLIAIFAIDYVYTAATLSEAPRTGGSLQ